MDTFRSHGMALPRQEVPGKASILYRRVPGIMRSSYLAVCLMWSRELKGTGLSRGPGRCQRRIVDLLEGSTERRLSRVELDAVLVEEEGYDPSNVLRAVRGLARDRRVFFQDAHRKRDSFVKLPRKVEPLPASKVDALLAEMGIGGRR